MKKAYVKEMMNSLFLNRIDFLISSTLIFTLFLTSYINYDAFHYLIEFLCIIISFGIFFILWNSSEYLEDGFLLFLSIGYVSVCLLDLIHTLSFNTSVFDYFVHSSANVSTQLWIAARYLQAFTLISVPFFINKKINLYQICEIFFLVVAVIFFSIFYLDIFPTAYIEGVGLTTFKIVSEYIIIFLLFISLYLFYKKKKNVNRKVFHLLNLSIISSILSESLFTSYFSVFGFSDMLGHFLKLISFLLIYKIIAEVGVKNPLNYIFKNLKSYSDSLRESELKLSSLVELATDAVILTDSRNNIELWNSSTKRIFGWKSKEVVGKSLDFIFPENVAIKEIIKNAASRSLIEYVGIRKNGEIFPLELAFSSWETNNGELTCYIIRDISERKKIEQELTKNQRSLESLVNKLKIVQLSMDNAFTHVVITDANGFIIYINKAAEELTGYKSDELIGKKTSIWGGQMDKSFYDDFWRTIKDEKRNFTGEIVNKKKNGELYEAEIRVSPVLDDKNDVRFFVAIERDLTQQKMIEKAKSEFISLAAHQLRTPLATISIASEMLLKGIVGDSVKDRKKYLKDISSEVKGMTEMVRVFLDVSRVEVNKFPIKNEPNKLFNVLEDIVQGVLPQIKYKKIDFKKKYRKNLPVLNLDKHIMKIIIENFLSNAIKYSSRKGKIILSVEEGNEKLIIKVIDNGVGIPKKDQHKIFTKMFRAENVSHIKTESYGLGLYLAKNLAEQIGYDISFESEENKGSTFMLSIPKPQV